jgi:acyl carrier protein
VFSTKKEKPVIDFQRVCGKLVGRYFEVQSILNFKIGSPKGWMPRHEFTGPTSTIRNEKKPFGGYRTMYEKIIDLIANELSVSRNGLTVTTHIQNDLGADSLDAVELIMSIEDSFHITIPEDIAPRLKTVGDIVAYLENHA